MSNYLDVRAFSSHIYAHTPSHAPARTELHRNVNLTRETFSFRMSLHKPIFFLLYVFLGSAYVTCILRVHFVIISLPIAISRDMTPNWLLTGRDTLAAWYTRLAQRLTSKINLPQKTTRKTPSAPNALRMSRHGRLSYLGCRYDCTQ